MPMPKLPKWVTRFHRTRTDYTPAIDKEGLKAKSPNMGENTYVNNAKDLENVWLADNRYNIPVLRRYGASPDVTTYKVRIPHDKYWYEMKRNTMPKGRGGGKFKPVKSGQPSMFSEGDYKVDLIGEDVPPQYLQKLPTYIDKPSDIRDAIIKHLTDYDASVSVEESADAALRDLPRRLRGEGRRAIDIYLMDGPGAVRPLSEELIRAALPMPSATRLRHQFNKGYKPGSTQSPAGDLTAALQGRIFPVQPDAQLSWQIVPTTKDAITIANTKIHQGSISRGSRPEPGIQDRIFDWRKYNAIMKESGIPYEAAYEAAPPVYKITMRPSGWFHREVDHPHLRPSDGYVTAGNRPANSLLGEADGDPLLPAELPLPEVKKLIIGNERDLADKFNNLITAEPAMALKDIEHPTWQDIMRAFMRLKVNTDY